MDLEFNLPPWFLRSCKDVKLPFGWNNLKISMPSSYWKNILPHLFTYFPLILICKPGLDLFNCPNRTSWRGGGAGGSNVRRPAPAVPLMLPFLIKICKTGMNLFNCPNCTSWWRQRVQPMQSEAGDGGGADGGNGRLPAVEAQEAAGAGSGWRRQRV